MHAETVAPLCQTPSNIAADAKLRTWLTDVNSAIWFITAHRLGATTKTV
jgi:hypothetical protein